MECTGAQILLESMKREGVDVLFGYPGGAVIDIYDELPRHPELRHVLVRHEQGAVHAADGYARASGKTGVCLVTSGPGATNTVTGIATAYSDSIPLVIFTGQVPTQLIGNDAFQEVDIVGITRPCTKHNFLVKDINKLALTIRQAFYLARSGRPGPVLIDLPKDVMRVFLPAFSPAPSHLRAFLSRYLPCSTACATRQGSSVIWFAQQLQANAESLRSLTSAFTPARHLTHAGKQPAAGQNGVFRQSAAGYVLLQLVVYPQIQGAGTVFAEADHGILKILFVLADFFRIILRHN